MPTAVRPRPSCSYWRVWRRRPRGISDAVEGAGLLVALVRGIVRDLIAEFVGYFTPDEDIADVGTGARNGTLDADQIAD